MVFPLASSAQKLSNLYLVDYGHSWFHSQTNSPLRLHSAENQFVPLGKKAKHDQEVSLLLIENMDVNHAKIGAFCQGHSNTTPACYVPSDAFTSCLQLHVANYHASSFMFPE